MLMTTISLHILLLFSSAFSFLLTCCFLFPFLSSVPLYSSHVPSPVWRKKEERKERREKEEAKCGKAIMLGIDFIRRIFLCPYHFLDVCFLVLKFCILK